MDNITFARNLVKGKIAETVFAQMLRESGSFTVLEFGYEKIIPDLVQNGYSEGSDVIETLRTAPDFAVIDRSTREIRLVEVKYRHALRQDDVLKIAKRMHESWNPSFLFVASASGFYFDEIGNIIKNKGDISKFSQIPENKQAQYMEILNDFEGGNGIFQEKEMEHLIVEAKKLIASAAGKRLSAIYFQRHLKIGYGRAAVLMEELRKRGFLEKSK